MIFQAPLMRGFFDFLEMFKRSIKEDDRGMLYQTQSTNGSRLFLQRRELCYTQSNDKQRGGSI